jgi:hypothetical protein
MKKPKYNFGEKYEDKQLLVKRLRFLKKLSIFGPTRIFVKQIKRRLNEE